MLSLGLSLTSVAVRGGGGGIPTTADILALGPAALFDISDLSSLKVERTGASATTPASVDGVVGTVLDLSGNGRHIVAPSDAARPLLKQTGSAYFLLFDGVDDYLFRSGAFMFDAGNCYAIVGVRGGAGQIDSRILTEGNSSNTSPVYSIIQTGSVSETSHVSSFFRTAGSVIYFTGVAGGVAFDDTPRVVSVLDNGSNVTYRIDGTETKSQNYTRQLTTVDRFSVGALLRSSASSFFAGNMSSIAIFSSLNSDELQRVESWTEGRLP